MRSNPAWTDSWWSTKCVLWCHLISSSFHFLHQSFFCPQSNECLLEYVAAELCFQLLSIWLQTKINFLYISVYLSELCYKAKRQVQFLRKIIRKQTKYSFVTRVQRTAEKAQFRIIFSLISYVHQVTFRNMWSKSKQKAQTCQTYKNARK